MSRKFALEKKTEQNTAYRKVIQTTKQMQLVLMCLPPNDFIKRERHGHTTQFLRVEEGEIQVDLEGSKKILREGDSLMIPPKMWHSVQNKGKEPAHLYTLYAPPEHPADLVQLVNPDCGCE